MIREVVLALIVVGSSAVPQAPSKKFEDMRAAEHLLEAENLEYRLDFANARKHLAEARRLYAAIRPGDREYDYAQAILQSIGKTEQRLTQREKLGNALQIVESKWVRKDTAKVVTWTLTLKNNSTRPLGNIQYRSRYVNAKGYTVQVGGISDVIIGTDHTIRQTVAPGSTRTIEIPDVWVHQEAIKGEFALVSWEAVATAAGR
jgi:hypothetical protein